MSLVNYTIKLKVLTPVYIGSGEKIGKKEYAYYPQSRKIYVMDSLKLFNGLNGKRLLNDFESFMTGRGGDLARFFRDRKITEAEVKEWAAYSLSSSDFVLREANTAPQGGYGRAGNNGVTFKEILSFTKDAYGCPYIPGSSFKGALRNAIESGKAYFTDNNEYDRVKDDIKSETRYNKSWCKKENDKLAELAFHTLDRKKDKTGEVKKDDILNDCMAGIRVFDSKPLSVNSLMLCQKFDLVKDKEPNALPIFRECLKPLTEIELPLEIDTELYNIDGEKLIKYIKNAFVFLSRSYYNIIKSSDVSFPKGNNRMVLGGGTGFQSKTVIYPLYDKRETDYTPLSEHIEAVGIVAGYMQSTFKDHKHNLDENKHNVSPHTRKLTKVNGKYWDMGICEVDIVKR